MKEQIATCFLCGCDDNHACVTEEGPCSWKYVDYDLGIGLCSACVVPAHAISLDPVYAWLVVRGIKTIENRHLVTKIESFCIHARSKKNPEFYEDALSRMSEKEKEGFPSFIDLPSGVLVGSVEIDYISKNIPENCPPLNSDPENRWRHPGYKNAWHLKNPKAYKIPLPYLGKQGIFRTGL